MNFRLKTILGIALIESLLLLILVLSSLDFLRSSNEEQLLQHAATTSKLFTSATKDAVLATDLASLESFVDEMLTNPEVVYVRIVGDDQMLAEGGQPEALRRQRQPDSGLHTVTDGIFDIRVPITVAGSIYGSVELGLSTRAIQNMFSSARQWATGIAVAEVVLVGIFSFVLGTYLTRSLQQLREASKAIVESGPGHQLQVSGSDEIADVAKAFNAMSSSLQHSYSELKDSLHTQTETVEQLDRNRLKYQAILSSSLDAIITIDQDGKVVDYNEAAERIFGWKYEEIFDRVMSEFLVPEELRDAHEKGMAHYLSTGEGPVLGRRVQLEAMHKSGRRFPVEAAISPIQTPDGPLFTAFLRNIGQQIADQTELRLAATAFDSIEPMFITDEQARIIRVNKAFVQNSGYQEEDVLGNTPSLWSSGRHDKAFYQSMWQALTQTGKWTGEIYNRRKNGEIYPDYLSISSVRDDAGAITHFVAHLLDITYQKTKERELRLASIRARKADEAKSRFLAAMSHEIRTPMNAVLGIFELLQDSALDTGQAELVKTGRESGELLLSIINDILDFSKMEADRLTLENAPFDLHQVLAQSVELLRTQANQKGLWMVLQIDDELPRYAKGDRVRLRQILLNLINNAVKFTHEGGVTIRTRMQPDQGGSFTMHCEVQDSGIGIPIVQQQSLFKEFSMVDQSHSRKYGGTGLGLAISKRLIGLMGGRIGIESQVGSGSLFHFHVKLESASPEEAGPSADTTMKALPSPQTRILLAEDNPANQRIFQAMLSSVNLETDIVSDGFAALEAVSARPYDLILMDISMPRMDGIAAARAIRRLIGPRAKIPIVAITAHSLSGDKERFLSAGMNDYLSKPVNKTELLDCITQWVPQPPISVSFEPVVNTAPEYRKTPEQEPETVKYVDEEALRQLVRDTSAEMAPQLLLGYIADSRDRLRAIEQALDTQDVQKLEFETHTLGSSAAAHGNTELHRVARHIEHLCRSGDSQLAVNECRTLLTVGYRSLEELSLRIESGFDKV